MVKKNRSAFYNGSAFYKESGSASGSESSPRFITYRNGELCVELHKTSVLSEPCLSLGINLQKMDGQVFIQLGKYYSV